MMHSSAKIRPMFRIKLNAEASLMIGAGSILDYEGDVIVNAANEGCVGGFGVDELINQAGGFQLKEARKALGGCRTGDAKITPSFQHTKVKYIVHAVGPAYRLTHGLDSNADHSGFLKSKDPLLQSAYRNALLRCAEVAAKRVGIIPLSAGVFRGARSLNEILEVGLKSAADYIYPSLQELMFVAYGADEQQALETLVPKLFPSAEKLG